MCCFGLRVCQQHLCVGGLRVLGFIEGSFEGAFCKGFEFKNFLIIAVVFCGSRLL